MLFLLFHIQSGVQTSKEDKKKDFAVKTGVQTEKEKEGFSLRKEKTLFRKLEGSLSAVFRGFY